MNTKSVVLASIVVPCISLGLLAISSAVAAKPAAGRTCMKKQVGSTAKAGKLKCKKVGRSFRWVAVATPRPATAPVIAPTPAPAPTTPPARAGSDRNAPIPLGQSAALGDGWGLVVVAFTPDATAAVLAENMFNDPPSAGRQYSMARVSATNGTSAADNFDGSYRLRAVGPSGVALSTFENSCGVIPDPISNATVFPGGNVTGNVCWSVATGDVGGLVLFDKYFLSSSADWTFLSLH